MQNRSSHLKSVICDAIQSSSNGQESAVNALRQALFNLKPNNEELCQIFYEVILDDSLRISLLQLALQASVSFKSLVLVNCLISAFCRVLLEQNIGSSVKLELSHQVSIIASKFHHPEILDNALYEFITSYSDKYESLGDIEAIIVVAAEKIWTRLPESHQRSCWESLVARTVNSFSCNSFVFLCVAQILINSQSVTVKMMFDVVLLAPLVITFSDQVVPESISLFFVSLFNSPSLFSLFITRLSLMVSSMKESSTLEVHGLDKEDQLFSIMNIVDIMLDECEKLLNASAFIRRRLLEISLNLSRLIGSKHDVGSLFSTVFVKLCGFIDKSAIGYCDSQSMTIMILNLSKHVTCKMMANCITRLDECLPDEHKKWLIKDIGQCYNIASEGLSDYGWERYLLLVSEGISIGMGGWADWCQCLVRDICLSAYCPQLTKYRALDVLEVQFNKQFESGSSLIELYECSVHQYASKLIFLQSSRLCLLLRMTFLRLREPHNTRVLKCMEDMITAPLTCELRSIVAEGLIQIFESTGLSADRLGQILSVLKSIISMASDNASPLVKRRILFLFHRIVEDSHPRLAAPRLIFTAAFVADNESSNDDYSDSMRSRSVSEDSVLSVVDYSRKNSSVSLPLLNVSNTPNIDRDSKIIEVMGIKSRHLIHCVSEGCLCSCREFLSTESIDVNSVRMIVSYFRCLSSFALKLNWVESTSCYCEIFGLVDAIIDKLLLNDLDSSDSRLLSAQRRFQLVILDFISIVSRFGTIVPDNQVGDLLASMSLILKSFKGRMDESNPYVTIFLQSMIKIWESISFSRPALAIQYLDILIQQLHQIIITVERINRVASVSVDGRQSTRLGRVLLSISSLFVWISELCEQYQDSSRDQHFCVSISFIVISSIQIACCGESALFKSSIMLLVRSLRCFISLISSVSIDCLIEAASAITNETIKILVRSILAMTSTAPCQIKSTSLEKKAFAEFNKGKSRHWISGSQLSTFYLGRLSDSGWIMVIVRYPTDWHKWLIRIPSSLRRIAWSKQNAKASRSATPVDLNAIPIHLDNDSSQGFETKQDSNSSNRDGLTLPIASDALANHGEPTSIDSAADELIELIIRDQLCLSSLLSLGCVTISDILELCGDEESLIELMDDLKLNGISLAKRHRLKKLLKYCLDSGSSSLNFNRSLKLMDSTVVAEVSGQNNSGRRTSLPDMNAVFPTIEDRESSDSAKFDWFNHLLQTFIPFKSPMTVSKTDSSRKQHWLDDSESLRRSLSILDRTPVSETHKIAILYTSSWTLSEIDSVLSSDYGSEYFCQFCENIGKVVNISSLIGHSGGLDVTEEKDGRFCLFWSNGCESVVFHLPHLMPSDAVQRKRHIGNDLVHIIFSDCEYGASFSGISGQFGLVSIIVRPCKQGLVSVEVQVKDAAGLVRESSNRLMLQSLQRNHIVDRSSAASFVRRLAIEADVVCRTIFENSIGSASNWFERLNILLQLS